jgi:hypothetical protein
VGGGWWLVSENGRSACGWRGEEGGRPLVRDLMEVGSEVERWRPGQPRLAILLWFNVS